MKPGRLKRFGASFVAMARHVARRPLLVLVLLSICVGTTVLQHALPQPWDGLPFGFGWIAAMWSISLTLPPSQKDQETDG
ncbi:hypothetical protein ACIQCQ_00070 [Streptomyces sp. NPDC088394]|uniref:hypothetical protein n=1 Tax=unclassified Streptomyces TaxID=2593676 RepID=UPI0033EA85E7